MATGQMNTILQHLRGSALLRQGSGLTDGQLLADYLQRREESALVALVHRHAAMVWNVCRRILGNHHDAEDAFQATFLVFVRKAAAIGQTELLANWLYGVARQTALNARRTAARRKERERQVAAMSEPAAVEQDQWRDLQPLLDQELGLLPDRYRAVVVLCDLEGKTRKDAAEQLGVPEGTLNSRLARARALLAKRLARHGVVLSAGALAALLSQNALSAPLPASLLGATVKAVTAVAAGNTAAATLVSAQVATLAEGVLKIMLLGKFKTVALRLLVGLLLLALAPLAYQAAPGPIDAGVCEAPQKVTGAKPNRPAPVGQGARELTIIAIPRPNSGTYTTAEATVLLPKTLEKSRAVDPKSALVAGWKNPTHGFRVHVTARDDMETVDFFGKKKTGMAGLKSALALSEAMQHGNPISVLLTSETDGWQTAKRKQLVAMLFQPSIQLYIVTDKPPGARPAAENTAWGKAIDGVEYGLAFADNRRTYHIGDTVTLVLKARNVGSKPTSITQNRLDHFSTTPAITDADGKAVKIAPAQQPVPLSPSLKTIKLAPQQIVFLGTTDFTIGAPDGLIATFADIGPGKYRVRIDSVTWKFLAGPKRPTGTLELTVAAEARKAFKPGTAEGIVKDTLVVVNEMADVTESIKDLNSARAARPKLVKILDRLEILEKAENQLGKVPQEEKERLQKVYAKEIAQVNARLRAAQNRLERIPGAFEALKDLGERLRRLGDGSDAKPEHDDKKEAFQPLPPHVLKPWKDAGAQVGWLRDRMFVLQQELPKCEIR
jgi:RNA polymerase sigma factor (sigma-70 family)